MAPATNGDTAQSAADQDVQMAEKGVRFDEEVKVQPVES